MERELRHPLTEGVNLILRANPARGRESDTEVTVQRIKGDKALVEVLIWGFVTGKRWVRLSELKEARWE